MSEIVLGILVPIVAAWGPTVYQAVMKGAGDGTRTVMKGAAPAPPLPVFTYRVVFEDGGQVQVRADDRRESSDSYTFLLAGVPVLVAPKRRVRFIENADQD